MSTFRAIRIQHNVTRDQIARITRIDADYIWAIEQTGRSTTQTWQTVIDALNILARTGYKLEDFSGLVCTNWLIVRID
jgi:transcriptional regulator with XRE-family HTH domain